jgi:hypothetical protein
VQWVGGADFLAAFLYPPHYFGQDLLGFAFSADVGHRVAP